MNFAVNIFLNLLLFPSHYRIKIFSFQIRFSIYIKETEYCWHHIYKLHRGFYPSPQWHTHLFGKPYNQRNMYLLLIQALAMLYEMVFSKHFSMVRGKNYNSFFMQPFFLKFPYYFTNESINITYFTCIKTSESVFVNIRQIPMTFVIYLFYPFM